MYWSWLVIGVLLLATLVSGVVVWQWHARSHANWSDWEQPTGFVESTAIAVLVSTLLTAIVVLTRWIGLDRASASSVKLVESVESIDAPDAIASGEMSSAAGDATTRCAEQCAEQPAATESPTALGVAGRSPQSAPTLVSANLASTNSSANSSANSNKNSNHCDPVQPDQSSLNSAGSSANSCLDSGSQQDDLELESSSPVVDNHPNDHLDAGQAISELADDESSSDSRFMPVQFLRILHRTKLSDVTLGDCTERTMAVMFADIRGFTTLSETMSPQENLHFLNAYLGRMERVIAQNQGFIDKYIGDAIMALFEGGADHAIEAAIGMLQVLQEYNEERIQVGRQPIRIGIGLDIGPLILGTIGGIHRMETTAIGDAVNLASRLEELTKQYSVSVLVSHRMLANVQNPLGYSIRFIDRLHVRGRTQPVAVYEVLNADPIKLQTLKRATASLFEEGVLRFHRRQYREAAALFEECLHMNPTDRATHIYLQRSVLAGFPPSEHTWQLVKGKVIHKRRRYRGRYRAKSR